jgi:hypothetical protein
MEGAAMQMNENVGQVLNGARHPKRKQALSSRRVKAGTPRQAAPADETHDEEEQRIARVKPRRYGSGF